MSLLELPVDHPRRGGVGGPFAWRTAGMTAGEAEALQAVAGALGTTPGRVALAAFGTLLHRYTMHEEMDLGEAGRLHFGQNPAFGDLVAKLAADRTGPGQVAFACGNPTDGPAEGTELALSLCGSELTAVYDTALFEAATVDRLLGHLRTLLSAAARDPRTPVGALPLLTNAERTQLEGWAGTAPAIPEQAVGALFEAEALAAPDRVAVQFGARTLTYAELNRRANRLAHHLRSLGVGPDVLVAICVERSLELIIGLLAILKAGGAYVPLDPNYPEDRLAFMLQDTGAPVLLAQSHLLGRLPASGARVVCLDTDWPAMEAGHSDANPDSGVQPRHLAYVSYTSGSTGRPKGVLVPHRAVVRLVKANHFADLTQDEVFLQLAPVPFDASTLEIWGALLNGARLVVMPPHQPSLEELAGALVEHGVTICWLTAGLFHLMVEHHLEALLAVRQVLAGGDVLSVPHVQRMLAQLPPGHRLINGYGPTENTTFTTTFAMGRDTVFAGSVPIGRPIANTQCYIVDRYMQPVPQGVPGELYAGGVGLAHGYLNLPVLTAERFVQSASGPLYRTGDLVRWLPDGSIEFLGRVDNQVKIRGFRIELGEIEYHLSQHPGVRDCVVIARKEGPGDTRLVAYVVGEAGAAALRSYLSDRLPDYMLPAAFVAMAELPLNPNGKVDRKALPAPDYGGASGEYVAPRTEAEEKLTAIWAAVLKVERVGVTDDFFVLGGHSLLATQVVSRVREQFGAALPLPQFFAAPTVAGMAAHIANLADGSSAPMERADRTQPLPLSFAQQRLWFFDQLTPGSPLYNIAEAVRLTGPVDAGLLEQSLNLLVARHESLRTYFVGGGPEPVQAIRPELRIALPVEEAAGAEAEELARAEARRPFDLTTGPLLRARLLKLGAAEHLLLLTLHHIIADGWSMGVLWAELGALYEALRAGRAPELPALPVQYADFAQWQRAHLNGAAAAEQLAYWRRELDGAPTLLDLPTDKPRPVMQSFRGAKASRLLPAGLVAALQELSRREGATLFMTLLAGFQTLLHRYTGQEDLLAGVAIANRTRLDTEGLIGFFVNTLPMRAAFGAQPTFRQLLGQVKGRALGAFANQDLPLEQLVEAVRPERDQSRAPLIQVLFAHQNAPMEDLKLEGVTVHNLEPGGVDTGTAKYDLVLTVEEAGGAARAVLEYCTDLYEPATAERLLAHFETLLAGAAAEPDCAVGALPLLTESERAVILGPWAGVATEYPRNASLDELFNAQAEQTPGNPAVRFGEAGLTYAELQAQANRVAHALLEAGVKPGDLVGLAVERSLELIVGLLGIVKAGAAYLPLDMNYPADRLAFMLADAGATVILTQERWVAKLPPARHICLDGVDLSRYPAGSPARVSTAESAAYAMYTSGSTGRPKGVVVPHRAVVRLVKATNFALMGPDEVYLQLAPVSFDAATLEIWGPLLNGGLLVVAPPGQLALEELAAEISRHGVTTLWLTAGLFHLMAEQYPEVLAQVRQLLAGGDVLSPAHVSRVLRLMAPAHRLINGYGPTENTTFTCCHAMAPAALPEGPVPIGRPIANTTVYLLDRQMQPVPVGVPGELYTGGDGLGTGYINLPELTAERFVTTPYGRAYRTGDLARWRPDGTIEFIGRRDNQVKIRGFRIELGEVESALAAHPAVGEVVVLAREDGSAGKRLVAYVTGAGPTPADLRAFMKERLPDYMVPSAFMVLDAFPLGPNGKVDRKALPAPEAGAEGESTALVAPRTPLEAQLAAVFAEVLGVGEVSIHDDFFALGGHSLLAIRAVSRVREALRAELPLRTLFERPTVAGLAEVLAAQAGALAVPAIRPVGRNGALPLSFAQQRLWFFDQLTPGSALYNVPIATRLRGPLSPALLEESLNQLAARQEALRTTFVMAGRDPVQVILPEAALRLHLVATTEEALPEQIRAEARRPFDLAAGPLVRAHLFAISPTEHVLLLNLHHIIADGWSMGVLFDELGRIYTALDEGREPDLAPLPVQYADFAAWQQELLKSADLQEQLAWWQQELAGAPTVLALPTDRPRPAVQSYQGDRVARPLAADLMAKLVELSAGEGATLYMTLLAAFQTLLSRYTGQQDLLVGSAVAGRNRAELEPLVGFFVNTLPMRADLSGAPAFRQLLRQVRERSLGALARQDVPLERLVEVLQPERNPGVAPLVQVLFALQNAGELVVRLPGVAASEEVPGGVHTGTAKYDLVLTVEETDGQSRAVLEYATDLFADATAHRLLGHFEQLLTAIAADPDQAVATLPMLTPAEEQQVLVDWNQTATPYPQETVQALFARRAAERPDAVAVAYGERTLTYGELERKANQLAHRLRRLGVGPDVLVAVCLERSPLLIVALLAAVKAGGAYMPLDADYPADRLAFMLEDGQAPVLLTQESIADRLPPSDATVLLLDRDWAEVAAGEPETPPPDLNDPDDVAYVIYTSGSTGRPKGTAVVHRGIVRLVFNTNYIKLSAADRVSQVASPSFDAFTFEIWAALLHGGTLVGLPKEVVLTPALMAEAIRQQRITVMLFTTAVFNQIALERPDAFHTVDSVMFGGEAADVQAVRAVLKAGGPRHLINVYGPTESTTFASVYEVTDLPDGATSVPIGPPISNTTCFVLDANRQPVPVGVPGELYIGGDGLAREYVHRPELTAERFVQTSLGRLYKTGDLVRWLPHGVLDYLGRLDHQVKIRGFRIELGEIETALGGHPAVGAVAVLAREDGGTGKRLVAYLTPSHGAEPPTPADLRTYLKERLPEFMVPAVFVVMEAMPLSPNGKVDRKALPAPESTEGAAGYTAPRTPLEEALAAIFAAVLEVQPVSIHDSFFELGGHSLLATRAVSRIREALQVELPLRTLFERPTVAELAAALASQAGALAAPPIRPVDRSGDLPLSFAQQRLWFLDEWLPGNPIYNVPLAYRLSGPLDQAALQLAFGLLVSRHEALRTTFAKGRSGAVQVIAPTASVAMAVTDLSHLPLAEAEAEAERLAYAEGKLPFDLQQGPLFRVGLIRLAEGEHMLLLSMHHIIADGWSLKVMMQELAEAYGACIGGREPQLPALPVQYADYAVWQQQWLVGDELERQAAYWRERLAGAPTLLELPTDRPRPPVMTYRGRRKAFAVPAHLEPALIELSRQNGTTLFMTLLAAWSLLLHRYSRQEEVMIGTPIAGRNRREVEGLIGFFVNTLVLRVGVNSEGSFADLLRQVKETALGAYSHQDLPFEKLVDLVQPERNMSYTPLYQSMFALQDTLLGDIALPGLTGRPLEPDTGTAKYDLGLEMTQSPAGLTATLEWATDLFDESTIDRMGAQFVTLLEAVVADPAAPVSRLNLVPAWERERLLVAWNRTERPYPLDRCLHQWIEEQVERTPEATALVYEGSTLSYAELNRRANQLAHRLRALGVGADSFVGVALERSFDMVIALVAVLKAGGAYVPVDPTYPSDRLAYMLADSNVPVLLTHSRLLSGLPAHGAHTLCLDTEWAAIGTEPAENPACITTPDHLAYMIYTSGSTGRPKGAMVHHRGIVNRLLWMQEEYRLTEADRVLQKTPFSFDVSVWEFFWPLMVGATLVIAVPGGHQDTTYLAELIERERVSTLHFVPSMLQAFLEEPGLEERCRTLRQVMCSGEALPLTLQERFFRRLPAELHNLYGPTEAAVDVTYWACERESDRGYVPIGRPVANTQMYVLDAHLQPVPIGVPGELHIGGVQVGKGYHNRPDLTAERFIADPFQPGAGARLYKTGDLARFRADGSIEYLGRLDHQVKIRGFRIELGEIEAALAKHPQVGDLVVVAREDSPGHKRVVAYLTPRGEAAPAVVEMRQFLKEQLPDYMVPSAFVTLAALPLLPNGKVNRKALPAPDQELLETGRAYVAPRTLTEEVLAAVWAQVLGVSPVSIDDNYFELGGDSIRSIRVRALAEERGLRLTLQDLFRHPTVRELAAALGERDTAAATAVTLRPFALVAAARDRLDLPHGLEDAYPVTKLQAIMLISSLSLEQTYRNVSGYVLHLPFDAGALAEAARELVQRHAILRTAFDFNAFSEPLQLVYKEARLPLEVTDLRGQAPEAELERWVAEELTRRWEWNRAPLARLAVHRLTDESFRLALSFHHAILDGWSVNGLLGELVGRYKAHLAGAPTPATPPAVTFRDFVALEKEALASEAARTYWQQQLADFTPAVPFGAPAADPGGGTSLENRYLEVAIDKGVSDRLQQLAREAAVPLKSLLLGAHLRVLAEATGRSDVMTGLVTNGRPEVAGGDEVAGLFLNTVPLRLTLPGGSWLDLGRQALAAEAAILPHRRFPLAEMRTGFGTQPPVEIYFNYTNFQVGRSQPEVLDVVNAAWSSFPLAAEFHMDDMAGSLRMFLEYDSRRFRKSHAEALALCYRRALEALASDPGARCDQPLLTEAERPTDEPAPALALDADTARQWLERMDELTEEQLELLLAIIAEKEGH